MEVFKIEKTKKVNPIFNLIKKAKNTISEKNLLVRFPKFDRRQILAAAMFHELEKKRGIEIPVEKVLESESWIGLLGMRDECECLNGTFVMRAHGVIHDACGRAFDRCDVGRGYCYAWNNERDWMKRSPLLGHLSGICWCLWNRKELKRLMQV